MERYGDFDQRTFHLGSLRIEPSRNLIVKDGQRFSIEPMIMSVLSVLAETPRDVISRDDFISRIWGVEFGADESLTRAISLLRKTFREAGEPNGYIETIPKRGYRLTQDVFVPEKMVPDTKFTKKDETPYFQDVETLRKSLPQSSRPPRKKSFFIVLGLLLVLGTASFSVLQPAIAKKIGAVSPLEAGRSVAVLSFTDMSPRQDQAYFADGLATEISSALLQIPDLRLVGRSSSFAFKGQQVDMRELGKKLNVSHVIDGSVRKDGEKVRVDIQLLNTADGLHMWSKTYDGTLENIFELQEEISQDIVLELKLVLSIGIEEVIDLQPRIALVDSLPGMPIPDAFSPFDVRSVFYYGNLQNIEFIDFAAALEGVDKRLAASPNNVSLMARKSRLHTQFGEYEHAGQALLEAERLDPLSHQALASLTALQRGTNRIDDAAVTARRNARWNPGQASGNVDVASIMMAEGDIVGAKAILENVLAKFPAHDGARQKLTELYMSAGLAGKAEEIAGIRPGKQTGMSYYMEGRLAEAYPYVRMAATKLRLHIRTLSPQTVDMAAMCALVLLSENDPDGEWLAERVHHYLQNRPSGSADRWTEIRAGLILAHIRSDPERFEHWMTRARDLGFSGAGLIMDAALSDSFARYPSLAGELLTLQRELQSKLL